MNDDDGVSINVNADDKLALKGLLLIPFVFYLNKGFSGGLILYSSNQAVDIKYQLIKEE